MDGKQPFDVIVLHGLVRDQFGKKMSKSRGNTIDPIEFMDKYGSDALRFTLARGANPGTDQALAEDWVAGSRNFATKLWRKRTHKQSIKRRKKFENSRKQLNQRIYFSDDD